MAKKATASKLKVKNTKPKTTSIKKAKSSKPKVKTETAKKSKSAKSLLAQESASEKLMKLIVAGMMELKAIDVTVIDLRQLKNTVCDFFVISHGNSNTHSSAIAGSVEKEVKKAIGENPWKREGVNNSQWIITDYVSVVAHIFQQDTREFYNIEDLWSDAIITKIN